MLSYQHRYHAGNFADVHKHLALTAALRRLTAKNAPLCVLDVHAGEGLYDLQCAEAVRNAEFDAGISRALAAPDPPPVAEDYLNLVRAENAHGALRFYPGSPRLAERMLRPFDRLVLVDLHPQAYATLKRLFSKSRQTHIHKRDSLEALTALLPPKEKRGLVVIDPSYEKKEDYAAVAEAVVRARRRFASGVYFVWYPLLPAGRHADLVAAIAREAGSDLAIGEWRAARPDETRGLYGSGVMIVNPPWKLAEDLAAIENWLDRALR